MKNTSARNGFIGFVNLAALFFVFGNFAHATPVPVCLDKTGVVLPADDDQVIQLKATTANLYLERAHVTGIIEALYPNQNGHAHFSLRIGTGPKDTLEIIYNVEFGALPTLATGMQVEACGDFINQFAVGGGYQPSPDGAILHWIHQSNSRNHQSGYVAINGVTYGLLSQNSGSSTGSENSHGNPNSHGSHHHH